MNELRQARENLSLTMQEAADIVGISLSYYSLIENGKRTPSGKVALKMADLLNKDIRLFFKAQ